MKLSLTYKVAAPHPVSAAFVKSGRPKVWLQTLSHWTIPLDQIECYAVPVSVKDSRASGLFILFNGKDIPDFPPTILPYGRVGHRLYLPIHAKLFPEVSQCELEQLLLYDRQFFHPTIGLVGFDRSDQVDMRKLLIIPEPRKKNWGRAKEGLPDRPHLHDIKVEIPSTERILEDLKKEIDARPLDELLDQKTKDSGALTEGMDSIKRFLLKKALEASKKIKDSASDHSSTRGANYGRMGRNADGGTVYPTWIGGVFGKVEKWMMRQLEELEKRREKEIQRLLRLFEENPEEALRYSIPLDGPYQNRGTALPSDRLGSRNVDFNLGRLGGGGRVDAWNLDSHYFSLRGKYQKAAKNQLEKENYRKAAYIYAHLLGDYHSAANALVQGKHFREAAILYKDHLKQLPLAAKCLEEGGLLLEAIKVYKELNKDEKIGDLYVQLDQPDKALPHYEMILELRIETDNYLEAYRICNQKLQQPERAADLLLEGWKSSGQAENCLLTYFRLQEKANRGNISQAIQLVYQEHTPKNKKSNFLNVLISLNKSNEEILKISRRIAYEIISEEATQGELSNLQYLSKFVSDDLLLPKDTSRYTYRQKNAALLPKSKPTVFQLDKETKWIAASSHPYQLLVLGIKRRTPRLARVNWKGHIEYYSWENTVYSGTQFQFVNSSSPHGKVFIYETSRTHFQTIVLPVNQHFFKGLEVSFLDWLPENVIGFSNDRADQLAVLVRREEATELVHYNWKGEILRTADCIYKRKPILLSRKDNLPVPLYIRGKYYYTINGALFFRIAENGDTTLLKLNSPSQKLFASAPWTANRMIISTEKNIVYLRPNLDDLGGEKTLLSSENTDPLGMIFLAGRRLVIASRFRAEVYDLKHNSMLYKFETKNPVLTVVGVGGRKQFALIFSNGLIQVYNI